MRSAVDDEYQKNAGLAGGDRPLVSVGIPTYNRPVGLRRTLEFICGQTYGNLEIIVSDNASPDPGTRSVAEEFAERDPRVRYFRQPANIGARENFRFALAKASGEYFMWAADDDEWAPTFIESCLQAGNASCSVMTHFSSIFRVTGKRVEHCVPLLTPDAGTFENVTKYFSNMQPSLFYGLHPRKSISFMLDGADFDFYDCYFNLRLILESNFCTIGESLYSAGIDAPSYEIKYVDTGPGKKRLRFMPFFSHSAYSLIGCSRLSISEKISLLLKLTRMVINLRNFHIQSSL